MLDSSDLIKTTQKEISKVLALFDLESVFGQKETFKETEITTWIKKHVPISVSFSISSNIVEVTIFFSNFDPHYLVASFIEGLES